KFPDTGFGGLVGRRDIEKPIIAAVNGVAMGGGFEMALACDLVVAADHATFALPEVKVGLIAGSGGLMRLPNQIPAKIASEMIYTGRPIDAHRAAHLGLANSVVPLSDLMQTARSLAEEIVANSPTSVRLSKRVLSRAPEHDVPEGYLQIDKSILQELAKAADTREGVVAFAEKRAPNWVNG
ncbi:MAG: enoyl-CoA hydratase-related protein, partial [Pseudomonadota bacterium]